MLVKGDRRRQSRAGVLWVGGLVAVLLIGLGTLASDLSEPANRELLWSLLRPAPKPLPQVSDEIERVVLRIEWEDLGKLERKREEALRQGILVTGPEDMVPAQVIVPTDIAAGEHEPLMKAKVRLKGDWSEHVKGKKWSFRVKLSGDGRLFGMKTFSLQHPRHRNGIHAWLYHQILRREGIVALRYRFVHLFLNQDDLGIYAVEEHFDRRLLEDNGHREGPILRLDESLSWAMTIDPNLSQPTRRLSELSDIRPYSASRVESDHGQKAAFVRAASLLESIRDDGPEDLVLTDALDVVKMARFYAIADLVGGHHGITWGNQRLFMNPITARLEPIGFDADAGMALGKTAIELGAGLTPLWRHQSFLHAYLGELERMTQPEYIDTLFADLGGELARQQAILASDPMRGHAREGHAREGRARDSPSDPDNPQAASTTTPRSIYEANQRVIRRVLQPLRALRVHQAAPALPAAANRIHLELVSLSEVPLEVVALTRQNPPATLTLATPLLLRSWDRGPVRVDPVSFDLDATERRTWRDLIGAELQFRVAGTRAPLTEAVLLWPAPRSEMVPPDLLSSASDVPTRPFLTTTEAGEIRFRPGTWILDRDLVIPAGHKLVAGAGVNLDLRDGASLLSYSPLDFRGQPEHPVVIHSSDRSGQGVVVLNVDHESRLEHVHIANLAAPRGRGWAMTGAVTFYQSPVTIVHSSFGRNHASDDALNIVRGALTIHTSRFHDTESDALDIDFGNGKIRDTHFERIVGDAVDVAGSLVTLGQSTFRTIGDKAVSVGENSQLRFRDLDIEDARMGLVSKDESTLEGNGLDLRNSEIGFAAFRKKPEYGPATLTVYNFRTTHTADLYRLEVGSQLTLESEIMPSNAENLGQQLYPDGAS